MAQQTEEVKDEQKFKNILSKYGVNIDDQQYVIERECAPDLTYYKERVDIRSDYDEDGYYYYNFNFDISIPKITYKDLCQLFSEVDKIDGICSKLYDYIEELTRKHENDGEYELKDDDVMIDLNIRVEYDEDGEHLTESCFFEPDKIITNNCVLNCDGNQEMLMCPDDHINTVDQ